ncbi:hypothetical protein GZ78_26065 [Endozoicomonas numazuensis]|uniref:Uncharacterized protein n=1 Tax=Endozoicomonas numazuensis TaxID=1137799 RepID=A0A081N6L8_9GAMM|nr:hypothetical protein GZ78_26065 [Endozoicomonas numazuensis]
MNPQQALEYFKNNTRFLPLNGSDKGICLGLACAWLKSVVVQPDTRSRLRQRLRTCSQNPQQGWHNQNQHYDSLQATFQAARHHYDAYRTANALPDHPATLESFEKLDAESAGQLQTQIWVEWLYREQLRQQGCSAEVTTLDKTAPRLSMTQAWPVVTTRASTVQLLRTLRDQPVPAHYLLTTGKHALALSIEKDRLTLFDQNAPCYIREVHPDNADQLGSELFDALAIEPECGMEVDDSGMMIHCGSLSTALPLTSEISWEVIEPVIEKLMNHRVAVWTLQAVLPVDANNSQKTEADWHTEWLTQSLLQHYPIPANTLDADGYSPLHLASRLSNLASVKALLAAGENPALPTPEGLTAFDLVCGRYPQISERLQQALQAQGIASACDPDKANTVRPLLHKPWRPSQAPLPDNLVQGHYESIQNRESMQNRLPGGAVLNHGSTFTPPAQGHCPAGDCGQRENSWENFKFRKALAAVGRGEDPLSRFVDRVEQVQDNAVRFVTDRHPILSAIMVTSRKVQEEFVAEQVDLLDRATGRVISQGWNQLDQNLKNELNGLLKVASILPAGQALRQSYATLYRAVGPDELADIKKTGYFVNRGSAEGKYFTDTAEHASSYARQAVKAFQDPPYTIVKTKVPVSYLGTPVEVDGGIRAFLVQEKHLKNLKPKILDSSEVPKK